MANRVFTLDGIDYDVNVIKLERSFEVSDSDSSGRTKDWVMHRDVVGTFYNYSVTIEPNFANMDSYNAFYEAISAPIAMHNMTFPYGNTTLTFNAYCTKGKDNLMIRNGINYWNGLTVNFIAIEPQKVA